MNSIEWTIKAVKQLRKLPQDRQSQVRDAVNGLDDFTDNSNVVRLKSHKYGYRLRVGDYRILFNHLKAVRIVSIEEVRKRDDRTY